MVYLFLVDVSTAEGYPVIPLFSVAVTLLQNLSDSLVHYYKILLVPVHEVPFIQEEINTYRPGV